MSPTRHASVLKATPKYKPRRDRVVPVTATIACPVCRSEVGIKCVRLDGTDMSSPHLPRRRMALRLLRERGEL